MKSVETNEMMVTGETSQGAEFRASVVRLTRHLVVFEVYNPALVFRLSEVVANFKLIISGRQAYSGRAVINNLINTGTLLVCEASLGEDWLDVDFFTPVGSGLKLQDQFRTFFQGWERYYKVIPEYKEIIADMQTFLMDLRRWLEQVELGIRSSPASDHSRLENEVAEDLGQCTSPILTRMFEKFEEVAGRIESSLQPVHRAFAQRQLHPLLMCSPFLYRTYHKPLGYVGDYEMVNMIVRPPHEGASLFAKIVNLWFLQQPPAEAHRNRIQYLVEKITEVTAATAVAGRAARILSLGCGPAAEVQRFLAEKHFADQAQFVLLDFNSETIEHARLVLEAIKSKHGRTTKLNFVRKSVNQIIKEGARRIEYASDGSPDQYDLVYCAGLFDYLPDPICHRLSSILYDWVAPGGRLITTNVDIFNPRRLTMDYIMEWHLIYRNGRQLTALKPVQVHEDDCTTEADMTGVNVYFEAKKVLP
jgi:extracellular factor (EF) 3-hydroxypalmitic acid methyl ester biosynthesis protein